MSLDLSVPALGPARMKSPIRLSKRIGDFVANYVTDQQRIVCDPVMEAGKKYCFAESQLLELAGPREKIFFDPKDVHAGVVTCGGLCPGLNDVIRALVLSLWHHYGVHTISGFRFGYRGLISEFGLPTAKLTPEVVSDIHRHGGTILGSSRGNGERSSEMAETIRRLGVNILFTLGGDGTQRGALALAKELERGSTPVAVVGIPKTIDNDLSFLQRSFGFQTAVAEAVKAVAGAHVEAHDAVNGVGLVKVMGRDSGFIAAHTALAMNDVNFVLVPEVPFHMDGSNGLLAHLKTRLVNRGHAVVLVAEGAGQCLFDGNRSTDESGNRKLGDIGRLLADSIKGHFREKNMEVNLKYIDPSYIIRSAPANPNDSIYCARLGTNAVHAAMAGKTQAVIGMVNNCLVHVPMKVAVARRNQLDPESALWRDVVDVTGQPSLMTNP